MDRAPSVSPQTPIAWLNFGGGMNVGCGGLPFRPLQLPKILSITYIVQLLSTRLLLLSSIADHPIFNVLKIGTTTAPELLSLVFYYRTCWTLAQAHFQITDEDTVIPTLLRTPSSPAKSPRIQRRPNYIPPFVCHCGMNARGWREKAGLAGVRCTILKPTDRLVLG